MACSWAQMRRVSLLIHRKSIHTFGLPVSDEPRTRKRKWFVKIIELAPNSNLLKGKWKLHID